MDRQDDHRGARDARVAEAYDALAGAYADHLADELDHKPFDRWLLGRVAALAAGDPIADVGCGPGHLAAHLAAAGAAVQGFDLSPAMVAEARRRFPAIPFEVADLADLGSPASAPGWAVIVAWYSLVHLPGDELAPAVAALAGALAPGGWLSIAVHLGDQVRRVDELFGVPVDLSFVLHDAGTVVDAVGAAGLVDVEWYRRGPYLGAEADTERLYVLARRRPAADPSAPSMDPA